MLRVTAVQMAVTMAVRLPCRRLARRLQPALPRVPVRVGGVAVRRLLVLVLVPVLVVLVRRQRRLDGCVCARLLLLLLLDHHELLPDVCWEAAGGWRAAGGLHLPAQPRRHLQAATAARSRRHSGGCRPRAACRGCGLDGGRRLPALLHQLVLPLLGPLCRDGSEMWTGGGCDSADRRPGAGRQASACCGVWACRLQAYP